MKNKIILLITVFVFMLTSVGAFAENAEPVNIILQHEASASSALNENFSAEMANDGILENESYTHWKSAEDDSMPWWQADLGLPYKISKIEMMSGIGTEEETRRDIRILGANEADFSDARELCSEITSDYGEKFSAEITESERVRYIKVEKTKEGSLSIGEIYVWVNPDDILQGAETDNGSESSEATAEMPIGTVFEDVIGTKYEQKVHLLSSLGIMSGYPDGTFKPEDTISRAEYTHVVSALVKYDAAAQNVTFIDVPSSHWAYDSVEKVYAAGLINGMGDGYFMPNDKLTAAQTIKVLVSLLGYGEIAQTLGGYPKGYMEIASKIGLTDDISLAHDAKVSRGDVALLIAKSLECEIAVKQSFGEMQEIVAYKGNTLLDRNFGLEKAKGIITACRGTSLTGVNDVKSDEYIEIDGTMYFTKLKGFEEYLGCRVEYYYESVPMSDITEIFAIVLLKGNDIVEIDAKEDIVITATELTYGIDTEEVLDLSLTKDVIYNGVALRNYLYANLAPEIGSVRLIDNNGDNVYDVLIIKNIENYVVKWTNTDKELIYVENESDPIDINSNDNNVSIINKSSKEEMEISDIAPGNVISVMLSQNTSGKKACKIIVSDDFVNGTLERVERKSVIIDGETYELSPQFDRTLLNVGANAFFYFDAQGKIAAVDDKNYTHGAYGFLKGINEKHGIDKTLQFRIFTEAGEFVNFNASEKLKVDEMTFDTNLLLINHFKLSGREANTVYQPIRYILNSKNEITKIDTLYRNNAKETDESLTRNFAAELRYYKSSTVIGMQFAIDNDTVMFSIPDDLEREKDYEIITSASLGNNKQYTMEAYDGGDEKIMGFLLFTGSLSGAGGSTDALFLVDEVLYGLNGDGERRVAVRGMYDGEKVEFLEYEDGVINPSSLLRGDVISLELSAANEIKSYTKRFYPTAIPEGATNVISVSNPQTGAPYSDFYLAYGKVVTKKDGMVNIEFTTNTPYASMLINATDANLKLYYYDSARGKVRKGSISDIKDAKTVGNTDASYVMFRVKSGDVEEMIVFD